MDNDLFNNMDENAIMLIQALSAVNALEELFNPNEMDNQGVDHNALARDILGNMLNTQWFFEILTNFVVSEFEELYALVVPTIQKNARST